MKKKLFRRTGIPILGVLVLIIGLPGLLWGQYVDHISPPTFYEPIYVGTQIVGVGGGTAGNQVTVYATGSSGTELVGTGRVSYVGWGPVELTRPLKKDEIITARQSKGDETSYATWPEHAGQVDKIPTTRLINGEKFHPPRVPGEIFVCQKGFLVDDVVEGTRVTYEISHPSPETGSVWTPYPGVFIRVKNTQGLLENQQIKALQGLAVSAPHPSDYSSPAVQVKPAPALDDERYQPIIITDSDGDGVQDDLVGTRVIKVCNTLTGATLRVYTKHQTSGVESELGKGVSAGGCTLVFVKPVPPSNDIYAQQWLCDNEPKSPPSEKVVPKTTIGVPQLEEPICEGAVEITVLNAPVYAEIELQVRPKNKTEFEPKGGKTASEGADTVTIGGGKTLQAGDQVRVRVKNETLVGTWSSPPSPVTGSQSVPTVVVKNGMRHGAVPNNSPVFYRGELTNGTHGPLFEAVMCSAKKALVYIIGPLDNDYQVIEKITLNKKKAGYFEGGWDWKHGNWNIPRDIPIGDYTARFEVTGSSGVVKKEVPFFVSFNHQEIRGIVLSAYKNFKGTFPGPGQSFTKGMYMNEAQVNQYFTGTPPKKIDCLGAARLVEARSLIKTLIQKEFDKAGFSSSDMHMYPIAPIDISQMQIGDWGYIQNDKRYPIKHPKGGYRGENIIKVGNDKYWGFPAGVKTYAQWEKQLINAYNSGLSSDEWIDKIPGFLRDNNYYFDAVRISVDVWNKARKPN
jgi:hypothetical protein